MCSWKDVWQIVKSDLGGGQGNGYIVECPDFYDDGRFFLKELIDQGNTERRRRFYIETVIYQSVRIGGIPEIIETNAEHFKEKATPLYYVAKFIDGTRLDKYVRNNSLSEEDIIDLFKQLVVILSKCHA